MAKKPAERRKQPPDTSGNQRMYANHQDSAIGH
ncbi:hypothetical protein AYX14_07074 [Cryptococcus neoformans]|nr:hypothetical protein AYX14_07074 [Cryptococcus neoformans var. grubii]